MCVTPSNVPWHVSKIKRNFFARLLGFFLSTNYVMHHSSNRPPEKNVSLEPRAGCAHVIVPFFLRAPATILENFSNRRPHATGQACLSPMNKRFRLILSFQLWCYSLKLEQSETAHCFILFMCSSAADS